MKKLLIILPFLFFACQKMPISQSEPVQKPRDVTLSLTDVNVGTAPNDGTGDPLRTFGQKFNANNTLIENAFANVYTEAQTDQAVVDYFDGVIATAEVGVNLADSSIITEGGYASYYTYIRHQYGSQYPTYQVQLIDGTIYAYPGINTGFSTIYSGVELADVINSVVAVVDSGAVIHIRDGHYNLTDSILLKSYVTYDFDSKARVCMRGNGEDYEGPVFYKPVATELRSATVKGGYFYGKIGENRGWNFCNLRSSSSDYPGVGNRFIDITMYYLETAFELVTTGSGWINANNFRDISCWSPTNFLIANNTSSNEISYNNFSDILVQANAWTEYGIRLIGETIFNQFVNVQLIDFISPMVAIETEADVSELNYFSGSFGYGGDEISDAGDSNYIMNGGAIASAFHTQGNVMHKPKNTGDVVAGTGITKAMLSRVMYYNGSSAIDITADPQIVDGEDGQIITIIGSSNTNTLKLDDDDVLGKIDLSATITLGQDDNITLIFIGSTSTWVEISRSNN